MQFQWYLPKYIEREGKEKLVVGGSLFNIWRVLHTNYILELVLTGQIPSKLVAVKVWLYCLEMIKQVEIANLKIWLWLAQLVEGTFCGDWISFFSEKNQNWIGGEQTWILNVKLDLTRQIFNGRCTFLVFFFKEATGKYIFGHIWQIKKQTRTTRMDKVRKTTIIAADIKIKL